MKTMLALFMVSIPLLFAPAFATDPTETCSAKLHNCPFVKTPPPDATIKDAYLKKCRFHAQIESGIAKIRKFTITARETGSPETFYPYAMYNFTTDVEIVFPEGLNPQCLNNRSMDCLVFQNAGNLVLAKGTVIMNRARFAFTKGSKEWVGRFIEGNDPWDFKTIEEPPPQNSNASASSAQPVTAAASANGPGTHPATTAPTVPTAPTKTTLDLVGTWKSPSNDLGALGPNNKDGAIFHFEGTDAQTIHGTYEYNIAGCKGALQLVEVLGDEFEFNEVPANAHGFKALTCGGTRHIHLRRADNGTVFALRYNPVTNSRFWAATVSKE